MFLYILNVRFGEHNSSGFSDTVDGTRSPQIGESVSMYDEQYQVSYYNVSLDYMTVVSILEGCSKLISF